ncbi:MAG: NAD(P)-dependent oxidoreductase [Gammaproteobacteria bacterium]|nr:NAD(P)-dependent oxidoreductase [Gammaproteobacteria bacterium]NNL50274.1 NAD(P)-dependent oxidoreductase [Woeseiaceae bacterium]
MSHREQQPDIRSQRLQKDEIETNFGELHPPLSRSEALIAADRCYFCYDAPCTTACPTDIDIPGFIQKIRSDNLRGSARTILEENIFGGMCARVCPTEVLCEEACVRHTHEDKPVEIGLLQRYATDPIFDKQTQLFTRAAASGKKVAVVGGGPAGLSCAHRLAMLGHDVVVFNRDAKPGGLNEYGIAAYKTVDDFAQKEAEYILSIGGIELRNGEALGEDLTLDTLRDTYDAVFIGVGLGSTNELGLERESIPGVENAIEYIAELRQAADLCKLPVGRRVVVIGGGMTAIDIAVQSKRLGAERVDVVYRRGPEQMGASQYEQDLAKTSGVTIHHWAKPVEFKGDAHVTTVRFERTALDKNGRLTATAERFELTADTVFKAIGQTLDTDLLRDAIAGLETQHDRIVVDNTGKTSLPDVWAGGDCVAGGDDLTVTAVQHGKVAAMAIDRYLRED